jgi:flagellar basal body-associated protein FliL
MIIHNVLSSSALGTLFIYGLFIHPRLRRWCCLYYAYGMSKKSGKLSKKRILTIVIITLSIIILLGGVAYYLYVQKQRQQVEMAQQEKATDVERKKLDETAFRGDRDLAAQYMESIQADDHDAAYQLYEQAAGKVGDKAEKIALYEQAVAIASQEKQSDQALRFAITLSELSDSHRASANVAYLYGLDKDVVHQKEYLQKAINQLATLPKDSAEYTSFMTYYQDMIVKLGTK